MGFKGQEKEQVVSNTEAVTAFFQRMSLLQRIEPVLMELARNIIAPDRVARGQATLPKYCYNILRILRKTYFNVNVRRGICRSQPPRRAAFSNAHFPFRLSENRFDRLQKLVQNHIGLRNQADADKNNRFASKFREEIRPLSRGKSGF
jgi:hypothetical protein